MPPQRSAVHATPPPPATPAVLDLDEPLLTVAQVAEQLAVDVYTVRRYIGRGHLEAFRIGGAGAAGQLRVRRSDLEAFLANARVVRA